MGLVPNALAFVAGETRLFVFFATFLANLAFLGHRSNSKGQVRPKSEEKTFCRTPACCRVRKREAQRVRGTESN